MPAVSVIIPVYNVEPYVAACVRSVFGQTLEDMEFIFVDDASTDRSMELVRQVLEEEFPARKPQVKCCRMPVNSGQAKVRMQGLSLAEGAYIAHCDADDELISADAYRLMYEKAVAEQLDIVTCNIIQEDQAHGQTLVREACGGVAELLTDKAQGSLVCRLFKRELLEGIIAPVGNMGEDLFLSVQLTMQARATGHVDKPLYLYKYHPSSSSKNREKESAIARHHALVANVRLLVQWLEGTGRWTGNAPEIICFKYLSRHCIEPYVGDKACWQLWKSTFPEVDKKVLFTPGLSLEKKGWFVLIHLRLYSLVKGITRHRRGA